MDHVVYSDGSTTEVHVYVTHDGCNVKFMSTDVNVTWEQMADVEQLSELFADVAVRVFKVVVGMLGKVYTGKEFYKGLV
jgi:hypothetical protein